MVPDNIKGTCFEKKSLLYISITQGIYMWWTLTLWSTPRPILHRRKPRQKCTTLSRLYWYMYIRTQDLGLRCWPYSWNTVNFSLWLVVCCFTSHWRKWRHHYRRRAEEVRPILGSFDLWTGRDLYRAMGPRFGGFHPNRTILFAFYKQGVLRIYFHLFIIFFILAL